jgi:hypothetical protein
VYADPRLVLDPWAAATKLAPLLHVDAAALAGSMSGDGSFVYLARQVNRVVADRIGELALPGVGLWRPRGARTRPGTLPRRCWGSSGPTAWG